MKLFAEMKTIDQIDLPEIEPGFWIKVRRELSVGEKRRVFGAALKGQTQLPDGTTRVEYNAEVLSFGLTCAHIVDWNATQEQQDGKVIPIDYSIDAVKGLTQEAYDVIEKAVDTYTEKAKALTGEAMPAQKSNVAPIYSSVAG